MTKINVRDRNKNIPNRKPNWEYRFEIAKIDGKRNFSTKSGFTTKKEAIEAATRALNQYENTGQTFDAKDISVSDFLDYWIENYAETNLAYATVQAYKNIIKNHIKPRIGFYKLKSVDTLTMQTMINNIYIECGFTRHFLKNILKVLRGSFKYAVKIAKIIPYNQADDVMMPKQFRKNNDNKKETLTEKEVEIILKRFKKSPAQYYGVLIGYYTGLRVSEVYGLTWDCIDLENKSLTVNKIVKKIDLEEDKNNQIKHEKLYLGECKTPTSYRTIKISDKLVEELKEYKMWQEKNKLNYREYYINQYIKEELTKSQRKVYRIMSIDGTNGIKIPYKKVDLVIVKENGEYCGDAPIKYLSKIAQFELGINFKFRFLRHTHATILHENGAKIKDIQERLGHSSILTTMNIYVENTDKNKENTVNIFDLNTNLNTHVEPINQRLYDIWRSMINRCNLKSGYYKERNISVCDEWKDNYINFRDWSINNGYTDEMYLERIDKFGNYNKYNCVWSTQHEVKSHKQIY